MDEDGKRVGMRDSDSFDEGWVRLVVTRLATDRWRRLGRWRAALLRSGPPEHARPPGEDMVMLTAALHVPRRNDD